MSTEDNESDLAKTEEFYALLRGSTPEGCDIAKGHQPKLTPDQAWTVIWWLGNKHWQVTDRVERCEVCGDLFHAWEGGECLDYGKSPYNFCGECVNGPEYENKKLTAP